MKLKKLIQFLEGIAPPSYQESYDNAGLLVGDPEQKIKGVLTCLDSTEEIVEEAVRRNCNVIVAHHPIIFKGLKSLTGRTYVERTILAAIRAEVAIYAIHTNLDNVLQQGVNERIAKRLGLKKLSVLAPKNNIRRLTVDLPPHRAERLRDKLQEIGSRHMTGASQHTFSALGVGRLNLNSQASIRTELLITEDRIGAIKRFMTEKIPGRQYTISAVDTANEAVGSGIVGTLPKQLSERAFLEHLKKRLRTSCIRHTARRNKAVKKVAVCGGAGGFLLSKAIRSGADVFVTADYKYHEFFDADGQIMIADVGHYESEQFTIKLLQELISENFVNFAALKTKVVTNPVHYYS